VAALARDVAKCYHTPCLGSVIGPHFAFVARTDAGNRMSLVEYVNHGKFDSTEPCWLTCKGIETRIIPYHAMRIGSSPDTMDPRIISGKRLRKSAPLPLHTHASDQEDLYYYEAQTSSLCWGPDESFWTELFLVDTYFGSEKNHTTYLTPTQGADPGDGIDPPLGGRDSMRKPLFDPRENFLLKIDRRIEQVATEYSALVETFNNRMEEYVRTKNSAPYHGEAAEELTCPLG